MGEKSKAKVYYQCPLCGWTGKPNRVPKNWEPECERCKTPLVAVQEKKA